MNKEAQRIAIAEACGWQMKFCKYHGTQAWHSPEGICANGNEYPCLPDYLNDLNSMHEAESQVIIPRKLGEEYMQSIGELNHENDEYGDYHATAPQRAEAFLKTLNLWKDQSFKMDNPEYISRREAGEMLDAAFRHLMHIDDVSETVSNYSCWLKLGEPDLKTYKPTKPTCKNGEPFED